MEMNSNRDFEPEKPQGLAQTPAVEEHEVYEPQPCNPDYESNRNTASIKKSIGVKSHTERILSGNVSEKPAPELNKAPLEIDPELCSVNSEH